MLVIDYNKQELGSKLDGAVRDRFRFVVRREDGRHSHTWALWGNRDDFYIASRSIGGAIKTSLHSQGGFRVHFDKNFLRKIEDDGRIPPAREVVTWPKPRVPDLGAVHVASLILPTDYLTADAPESKKSKPVYVFNAPNGRAVDFGFFYSREGAATLEAKFRKIGVLPLIYTTLDCGEIVSTAVRVRDFDPKILSQRTVPADAVHMFGDEAIALGETRGNLYSILFNDPKDGGPLQITEVGGVQIRRNE